MAVARVRALGRGRDEALESQLLGICKVRVVPKFRYGRTRIRIDLPGTAWVRRTGTAQLKFSFLYPPDIGRYSYSCRHAYSYSYSEESG